MKNIIRKTILILTMVLGLLMFSNKIYAQGTVTLSYYAYKPGQNYDRLDASNIPEPVTYATNVLMTHIVVPTSPNYTFKGWIYYEDGIERKLKVGDHFFNDTDFYATWDITVRTVRYQLNEGVNHESNPRFFYGTDDYNLKDPTKENFVFMGWFNNLDEQVTYLGDGVKSVVLQAKWALKQYNITFDINYLEGTNPETLLVEHGSYIEDLPEVNREGYDFLGWYHENELYNLNQPVIENIVLEAKWQIKTFEVVFKDDNGATLDTQTIDYNNAADAPVAPVKAGYTFTGWDIDFSQVKEDLTVIAIYTINTYSVTFKDFDDTTLKTETVEHGQNATAPANPNNKNGYHFVGWDNNFTNITNNVVVVALYEINTYTVTFKDYDETIIDTQEIEHGSDALAPAAPTRTGYAFTNWSLNFNNITEEMTIFAVYEINMFEVTFKDYDDTVLSTQSAAYGSAAIPPAEPDNRPGYHFATWDRDYTNITENSTFYAEYDINVYLVTFVDFDDTVLKTEDVDHGDDATPPAEPDNLEGHHFLNWDNDYTEVTANLTVKAVYKKNGPELPEDVVWVDIDPDEDVIITDHEGEPVESPYIPDGQYFVYDGLLYVSTGNYQPSIHGVPGESEEHWAFTALDLEWIYWAYPTNRVVKYDEKYYRTTYNWVDKAPPFEDIGAWERVDVVDETAFEFYENKPGVYDYTKPLPGNVTKSTIWDPYTVYVADDEVLYDGVWYIAKYYTFTIPGSDGSWKFK